MPIGFIGLGLLGLPIATNLLDNGHDLLVFNRTAAKADPLIAKGARLATSVADLARECQIVFSIVFDDAAVKAICESDGLLEHLAPGSIHVCLSTISPSLATTLADEHSRREIQYVSAPVFGRPEAAVARQLQYAVAGPTGAKAAITRLLQDSGGSTWDFGEKVASANLVKLCGNFLIIAAGMAIRESTAIARASGLDAQAMWAMLNQGLIKSPLYQSYSDRILQAPDGASAFSSPIPMKDLRLLSDHAALVQHALAMPGFLMEQMASASPR